VDENKHKHGPMEKRGHDYILVAGIGKKIRDEQYSPYAVTAGFNHEGWPGTMRLSSKTLYRYMGKNMFAEISEADLPCHGKIRKKSGKPPKYSRVGATDPSIDKRPLEATGYHETGHGEMDTVKGVKIGSAECLLTLTERKPRVEIIRTLQDCRTASVTDALDTIEKE
jgi:IS30 family transposase